jgi:hypothetical protein
MKNKSLLLVFLITSLAFNLYSCGPRIDEYPWQIIDNQGENNKEEGMTLGDVETSTLEGELLSALSLGINFQVHNYQYQRANSIDMYAGYFTVSNSDFQYGGPLPYAYYYPNNYINGAQAASLPLYPYLYHAYFYADNEKHKLPEWKAIAQIMYVLNIHQLVDFYGVMPYNDYRKLKETPPLTYIDGKTCYELMVQDLDEAIDVLKKQKPSSQSLQRIEGEKGGYSNLNWKNWVKLANSIKLRLALNAVKATPVWSQELAEQAVNDEIGVLTASEGDFQLPDDGKTDHPLYQISSIWNDSRLGASLENILKSYQNPLLSKWFAKNSADIRTKTGGVLMLSSQKDYLGIRQGVQMYPNSGSTSGYGAFSAFSDRYMPRTYMKIAEILFLKAEGALRGWNMGKTAQEYYEEGIRQTFTSNGISMPQDYLSQILPQEVPYQDYFVPEWSMKSRLKIGVKWNNNESDELKLEKIITQKYIGTFPMGGIAWTTFRRTGYPRLFPVPEKYKWTYDDSFDVELQIRRIPFNEVTATEKANVKAAESVLGGLNQAGTRIWWDIATESRVDDNPTGIVIPKNF